MPMSASLIPTDPTSDDAAPSSNKDGSVPSGFILKLYQMVNGAPDDVISWTTSGDAFRIGADLNRLESETLPQYFRHSRFQSLVRQLNFYNFRKVNRERTFWIYKHKLFHRDHPENLHLLRRRTCPGVDGRKNRFSNYPRKSGDCASVCDEGYDEDMKSSDESTDETEFSEPKTKKRRIGSVDPPAEDFHKLTPRVDRELDEIQLNQNISVDLSIVGAVPNLIGSKGSNALQREVSDDPDCSSEKEVDERVARREQAHVVNLVAMKLEEYARKAKRSRAGTRSGVGMVTPPLGGHIRSVLTYDDEYDAMTARCGSNCVPVYTTVDGDINCDRFPAPITPCSSRRNLAITDKPPVGNSELAKVIYNQIMEGDRDPASKAASATVAYFCMTTPPNEAEGEVCAKILAMMSRSERLGQEFMQYRHALRPIGCSSTLSNSIFCTPNGRNENAMFSIDDVWEGTASRRDALRDFKTFAVNYMNAEIARMKFVGADAGALRKTADAWLKSASTSA